MRKANDMDYFSESQITRKQVRATASGVVASQHKVAAQAGADVLRAGGDAVDAAVATSFALGVVEPWMSGMAAGGCMVLWRAKERRAYAVNFGMRSPVQLDPADYPLSGLPPNTDLFPWAAVVDDRNVRGATAVAVPGVVAGMQLAHERFGRTPWRELVMPAVGLARQGMAIDWYSALLIASSARALADDPDAARMFLDDGHWPKIGSWAADAHQRLDQSTLAQSLRAVADEGAAAFYGGDVGQAMVRDIRDKGGCMSLDDLRHYRAEWVEPLEIAYRGGQVLAVPGMTGGPTLAQALRGLDAALSIDTRGAPGAQAYQAMACALQGAFRSRLSDMGDHEPPKQLTSTTHFSVVDAEGNLCAVTQTLLSIFGSRVVSPATGLLLNNGIMWFDPEPGRANSLAPGKRCLANYCPVIGTAADGRQFAIGASGGRKIIGAVMQLASFMMAHGMSLEEAFHQPRIDVSGGAGIVADQALPAEVQQALAQVMPVTTTRRNVFPYAFACPAGVMREGSRNMGCAEVMSPWGDAVHG